MKGFDWPTSIVLKKQDRISYILQGVCEYYDIDLVELQVKCRKPEKMKKKRFAIKLLYDIADCRYGDIGIALGGTSGAGIWQSLDIINDDLSVDKRLMAEYNEVKRYLRL